MAMGWVDLSRPVGAFRPARKAALRTSFRLDPFSRNGQRHEEGCTAGFPGIQRDLAAVLRDDLLTQGQPQPGPVWPRGEEGLEQVLPVFRGNARSRVREADLDRL